MIYVYARRPDDLLSSIETFKEKSGLIFEWAHTRMALEPETKSPSSSSQRCCVLPFPSTGKGGVRLGLCKIKSIEISGGGDG